MDKDFIKRAIQNKSFGFIYSIEKMGNDQKMWFASKKFGTDYNLLIKLVSEHWPELTAILPPLSVIKDESDFRYTEIHTYCSQIHHILESKS